MDQTSILRSAPPSGDRTAALSSAARRESPAEARPGGAPAADASAARRRATADHPRRICLVGAGNIAATHAQVLQTMPTARIAAVVDPNLAAAQRLAQGSPGAAAYASVEDALRAGGLDAAHVLAPPPLHAELALPWLEAGCAVLVEKPLGASADQCETLVAAAGRTGATLGVNQNFVFHPAFSQLRREVSAGRYGPLRFVDCVYNMPLRQLAARQFGHWMFDTPGNLLLEQCVHPMSQIIALAGPVRQVRALAGPSHEIAPRVPLFTTVTATLDCAAAPAQLRFAVGQSFPFWRVSAVCDDGVLVADILDNRCYAHARTPWLDPVDRFVANTRSAGAIFGSALRNAGDYVASTLRLQPRSDGFFRSMQGSIGAFHDALDAGRAPELDGAFGAAVVSACDAIAAAAYPAVTRVRRVPAVPRAAARPAAGADVVVLGGTGFIGAETVRRLLAQDRRVAVLARSTRNLPATFGDVRVRLHTGDIRNAESVARAVEGARVVINLAHGGGGADYAQVKAAMVGGAETVARACLTAGVERLIHVSSIAALYLGPQAQAVTGATGPDPRAERRADYARAKAECERRLLEMHQRDGLPVCILRPGLVVGEGTSPFHSGLGLFNTDQHCIGWNRGRNPLPFVLVGDVAEAIVLAAGADAGLEGRCYNLVGDVRPSAREYTAALAQATARPLKFHPCAPAWGWAQEAAKWLIKLAGGRRVAPPSRRDLLSRGLEARFDCSDAKRDLGWAPVADPEVFARLAIEVHGA